jgi:hypothetical protein
MTQSGFVQFSVIDGQMSEFDRYLAYCTATELTVQGGL